VEATVEVRPTSELWPDGLCCRFEAFTGNIELSVVLLGTADDHVPLNGDDINLAW
jgi:hypothetical protein